MKILHTADWHLGKKLDTFSRIEEQRQVMQEICEIAEQEAVDAVVIAGDLFDTFNPSSEAFDLFYKTLKRLSRNSTVPVIAIAGNHDSPDRIEAPDPLATQNAIFFLGYPDSEIHPLKLDSGVEVLHSEPGFIELKLPNSELPLRLITTPYANEVRIRKIFHSEDSEQELREILSKQWMNLAEKYCNSDGVNLLVAHHFFVSNGQEAIEEIDEGERPILHLGGAQSMDISLLPKGLDYVALGHLHRYQNLNKQHQPPVIYSGSPLSYSFSEANQTKYISIIEKTNSNLSHRRVELTKGKPLLRKRAETLEEALNWLKDHQNALVELTLVRDSFLTSEDRQLLNNTHSGIVSIIPEIQSTDTAESSSLDLTQNIEELFKKYYLSKNGIEANAEILNVFREILSEQSEQSETSTQSEYREATE